MNTDIQTVYDCIHNFNTVSLLRSIGNYAVRAEIIHEATKEFMLH